VPTVPCVPPESLVAPAATGRTVSALAGKSRWHAFPGVARGCSVGTAHCPGSPGSWSGDR
jgi:hypothetical protein